MYDARYLIISLGNPFAKYKSLHSAGHFAINGLPRVLNLPAFREVKYGKQRCQVSEGDKYTLIQSPTFMNVSGPFVLQAFKEACERHTRRTLGLLVVHDEMTRDFGAVRIEPWTRSSRGHNGMKSVKEYLNSESYPDVEFARISIGIGRPRSKKPQDVADYVLADLSQQQRDFLENDAPAQVGVRLSELAYHWENKWLRRLQRAVMFEKPSVVKALLNPSTAATTQSATTSKGTTTK
ncbi:hypothetical protein S40285_00101 [Stachybotrys chlorohalonatus IBT 40285]|uniref:peptidyl-tRNA hydrolase n=1 Tax=Stachybotrys chlorohalonatus (strain IBT 40285) TaxID=1283841 RepID=A0A084QYR0_STAC4|nr:hypothetical protein S40285_00101 [Stachybotrys chlorohalonata IBT 40285]